MKEGHFFDKPENVKRVLRGFYIFLVLIIVVALFIPKHPFFPWEGYPSFYGVYGFVSYIGIVFGSTILRKLLKRKEDYYDD